MAPLSTFADFALRFADYKYPLIFVGTIIEGPLLMIICGFLLKLNILDFVPLYISILLGDLAGDIIWYSVGRYVLDGFVRRYGKFVGVDSWTIEEVKRLFQKYHERILFISKITIGFGASLATLIVAGASKISFWRYLLVNFVGELILVLVLFLIGYSLGNGYALLADNLKYYFIGGIALLLPLGLFFTNRYFKRKLFRSGSHS